MNQRLDVLLRKNKGTKKLKSYSQFFKGFNLKKLEYIELEASDIVLDKTKAIFPHIDHETEIIKNAWTHQSKLIIEILERLELNDTCYVFTDDVYECGMFKAYSHTVLKECLTIAFLAETCFVTDADFNYSFTINHHDEIADKSYSEGYFDIKRKTRNI